MARHARSKQKRRPKSGKRCSSNDAFVTVSAATLASQRGKQAATTSHSLPSTAIADGAIDTDRQMHCVLNSVNPQSCVSELLKDRCRVLVVGCADFSWCVSIASRIDVCALVATSFDSREELDRKYGDAPAQNILALQRAGARVYHGVDATSLNQNQDVLVEALDQLVGDEKLGFDRIVFIFPHTGGQQAKPNQELLLHFLLEAQQLLRNSSARVLIALRNSMFYNSWNLPLLVSRTNMRIESKQPFDPGAFLGYVPQRTHPAVRQAPGAEEALIYVIADAR